MGSLDGYNNFLGAFNLTGPLFKGNDKTPLRIGFLLSGEATYDKDGYPAQEVRGERKKRQLII